MKNELTRLALLLAFLLAGSTAHTQQFELIEHRTSGEVQEAYACDLDGDSRQEVMVSLNLHGDEETTRHLKVFGISSRQSKPGIALRSEWQADPEAVFWGVGPASEGRGKQHCYFLTWDGLWELTGGDGTPMAPRQRIKEPVFVTYGQKDGFLRLDFIRDWDGDGQSEVFLPFARQARFYRPTGEGWKQTDLVNLVPFPIYNNNVLFGRNMGGYQYLSILFFPLLVPADLNGDGRLDLMSLKTGKAECFFRGPNGRLSSEPVLWNLDIRTKEERIRRQASLTFRVADLNRDGCADVVVHKVGVRFTDWSAETAVFLGNRDGAEPRKAFQRFPTGGLLSGVSVEDLDGDGNPDLAQWSVQMGLWPFVEILLRKTVHLNTQIFYANWPGGFPVEPEYRMGNDLKLDFKKQDMFRGLVPNVSGDFDGDGVKDLVASKDLDTLAIYLGLPRRGFSAHPWATLKAPGVNYVTPTDLNGDGLSDLYGFNAEQDASVVYLWLQQR